jgi:hypothetical protein
MKTVTPSPATEIWFAEPSYDGFFCVINRDSVVVAQKCVEEEARLIAAAPELLEHARALIDNWENGNISGYIQSLAATVAKAQF